MKRLLIIILSILPQLLFAQYEISGNLYDAHSQSPIANARIVNGGRTALTGSDGRFKIEAQKGLNYLKIKHVAYLAQEMEIYLSADSTHKHIVVNLEPATAELDEVTVIATKERQSLRDIPYRVFIINNEMLELSVRNSVDDVLKTAPGMQVFRPMGFYQSSPTVGFNGTGNEAGRSLVLLDGVPLNKADNGNVNFNRISPELVERIEILHNGSASVYGSNSVNGVVNIVTRKPKQPGIQAGAGIEAGSYGTLGGDLLLTGKTKDKKFGFRAFADYRKSDGLISTPDSLRDPSVEYIPSWLEEFSADFFGSYQFDARNILSITYNYYDDARSLGEKIREENGTYTEHDTHYARLNYQGKRNASGWQADVFFSKEDYFRNMENIRQGSYSLIHVNSDRQDYGASLSFTQKYLTAGKLTTGIDYKRGSVYGQDSYLTSDDKVINQGVLNETDVYIQNQNTFKERLRIIGGLHYSKSRISDAAFTIENPSSASDFMLKYSGDLEAHSKQKITASAVFKYRFNSYTDISGGYNSGFRNPTLDDMTRSGMMYMGFKLANPELMPEWSDNFQLSANFTNGNTRISLDGTYSIGRNYMAYLHTGESVFGGRRPVVQLSNISEVISRKGNLSLRRRFFDKYTLYANYSFTDARINSFEDRPELVGNQLIYTPVHGLNSGMEARTRFLNFGLAAHYRSEQFTNDENTESIDAHTTVDLSATKDFGQHFRLELSAQNVFDRRYLVYYTQLSLGRFLSAKVVYKIP